MVVAEENGLRNRVRYVRLICWISQSKNQGGRLAQLARASRLHREGRGFESLIAHQTPPLNTMEHFSYTYVLKLTNNQLYIGSCDDLERRMKQHSSGHGGRTTSIYQGELIYFEGCRSLEEARKREKQLKTGFGRAYLKRRLGFELPEIL